jgi:hypothetical protein
MPSGKKEESSIADKIIYVPSLTKPILAIVDEASLGMKLEFCIKYSYRSFLHVRATGRISQIPMSEAYLVSISNSNWCLAASISASSTTSVRSPLACSFRIEYDEIEILKLNLRTNKLLP